VLRPRSSESIKNILMNNRSKKLPSLGSYRQCFSLHRHPKNPTLQAGSAVAAQFIPTHRSHPSPIPGLENALHRMFNEPETQGLGDVGKIHEEQYPSNAQGAAKPAALTGIELMTSAIVPLQRRLSPGGAGFASLPIAKSPKMRRRTAPTVRLSK
jgi:hypothetical protein